VSLSALPRPALTLDLAGVRAAADVVAAHLPVTPTRLHPALDEHVGARVVVKHEQVLPTGSFKIRGGVHLASCLGPAEVAAGLVTSSTGNHAQSVAYAARLAGTSAVVVMPTSAPEVKRRAVEALGARVVLHGPTLAEAGAEARRLEEVEGRRRVCPAEAAIILGHATAYLELFSAHPDLELLTVPVGSGTGAAGAVLVRDGLAPGCRVVGVQSEAAPAAWRSWRDGEVRSAPCRTRVSGLATAAGYALPQSVMTGLDDFVLVPDEAIIDAARLLARHADVVAEGAGAASLAGLLAVADRPRRCAVVVTGGNASQEELAALG